MEMARVSVGLIVGLFGLVGSAAEMPRVASYSLEVTYLVEGPEIEGLADVSFEEGAAFPHILTFFLHGELRADEVLLDGMPLEVVQDLVFFESDYSSVARRCQVKMRDGGGPKVLSIRYGGKLNPSVVRAPSNYMRVDGDGVFLRSFPYSVWFPVFLDAGRDTHPVDVDLTIRTPAEFTAVATGQRLSDRVRTVSESRDGGRWTMTCSTSS
jgi:hypothetical protein